jgi:hypothetical protein
MDTIKCPVCGEVNPADAEFCQNCQSRLKPLAGSIKGEDAPLQPGQIPTKKSTAELEPVLPQWLREAREQARQSASGEVDATSSSLSETKPVSSAAPDLLAGLASQSNAEDEEEIPDWLAGLTGNAPTPKKTESTPTQNLQPINRVELGRYDESPTLPEKDELSDWLSRADQLSASPSEPLPAATPSIESAPATPLPRNDTPDWLNNLQSLGASFDETLSSEEETPALSQSDESQINIPEQSESSAPAEVPDWLKAFGQEGEASSASSTYPAEMPDWLKNIAPQSESEPQPAANVSQSNIPPVPESSPSEGTLFSESEQVDWLPSPRESAKPPTSVSMPAFVDHSMENVNVDDLYTSLQTPEWLNTPAPATPEQPSDEKNPSAAVPLEESELPSWVQAMRPVGSAIPSSTSESTNETFLEAGGPLAGLSGVLPVGMFHPTSKPKTQSIKLNATDEHQTQSALLEQILSAETTPIPMKSTSVATSQRVLRWVIAALVVLFVGGIFFMGTQLFALPSRVASDQTEMALSAIEKVSTNAPVLVVFDYEPSLSGEMQTVAEPYLRRLLLEKQPRFTILSSSPTGSALAEQFMSTLASGPMAIHNYQRGKQYIDLGYLPGGLAGVYDFAQNPSAVMPFDVDGLQAWDTAPLKGVTQFSDFSAIIILTDSAETGRVWIEQAGPLRGNASFVVVSSSQAGPMLMPYFASSQINGLVNGLNDASKVEQANGQAGLASRYWDAYSVGLLLAAVMILLGGLWNIVPGIQSLGKEKGGS